ncbi:MAG: hypothetical protein AAB649_05820, partial [Patescibacteria group bacterium]
MSEKNPLTKVEGGEMINPFPLYTELFQFADKEGLGNQSLSAYTGEYNSPNYKPVALPEKFSSVVRDYPDNYFVVAYEDRRDRYFKKGTNTRMVRLSTVPLRNKTNEKIREIDVTAVDPTRGNYVEIAVSASVNNRSFDNINTAQGAELDESYGQSKFVYKVEPNGKKYPQEASYGRLDEGLFQFGESKKPVRWVRDLSVEYGDNTQRIKYSDMYIIGRSERPEEEKRAQIKTHIAGKISDPESVLLEIGIGSPQSGKTIYHNKDRNIKVIAHEQIGSYKGDIDTLKDDPVYSLLLRDVVNENEFLGAI